MTAPVPHLTHDLDGLSYRSEVHPAPAPARVDSNPGHDRRDGATKDVAGVHSPASPHDPFVATAGPGAPRGHRGLVRLGRDRPDDRLRRDPPAAGSLGLAAYQHLVTLPVGVEAYAAYALRAWLTASPSVSARTRCFARWSAIGSLVLGMAGQIAHHLLAQVEATNAPWGVTTTVSCLPVLVLGMGTALAHLIRADAHHAERPVLLAEPPDMAPIGNHRTPGAASILPGRLPEAQVAAAHLTAMGQRVSRRTLRAAGVHGSNADLGRLALALRPSPSTAQQPSRPA
ncbi:MAG TPA: hypothetical protein VGS19_27170 [Streptosporangiaceae bacterium]|nr:hypothetical protein [Streptosporangiaceae bacterium]